MSLDHTKASRFGRSRTRTGCLTCVRRHVRCDEGRPSCTRCIQSGRQCEQRPGSSTKEKLRIIQYGSNPSPGPNPIPGADADDLRYLEYFRLRTAVELADVHDMELWSTQVYQIAFQEQAIWHAVLALAFAHEQFQGTAPKSMRTTSPTFGFVQYDKAIKALITAIDASGFESEDVPLLACVLFSAFESMSYHLHSALSHIHSGSKLMYEPDTFTWIKASRRGCFRLVDPIFAQLDTQRLQLGDSALSSPVPFWKPLSENPDAQFTMDRARYTLNRIVKGLMHKALALEMDQQPLPDGDVVNLGLTEAITAFREWESSFDILIRDQTPHPFVPSALLLQLWRVLINIVLHTDLNCGETGCDDFTTEFEMIVSLSDMYLRLLNPNFGDVSGATAMTLDYLRSRSKEQPRLSKFTARVSVREMRSGSLGIHPTFTPLSKPAVHRAEAVHRATAVLLQRLEYFDLLTDGKVTPDRGSQTIKPSFSFSHGIVYPLYVTVTRCRIFEVRRKAWMLLRTCKRREGLWDSDLAAELSLRIMAIEHSYDNAYPGDELADDSLLTQIDLGAQRSSIPNEARVRLVKPTFLANRNSVERYYLSSPAIVDSNGEVDEVWLEETMTW